MGIVDADALQVKRPQSGRPLRLGPLPRPTGRSSPTGSGPSSLPTGRRPRSAGTFALKALERDNAQAARGPHGHTIPACTRPAGPPPVLPTEPRSGGTAAAATPRRTVAPAFAGGVLPPSRPRSAPSGRPQLARHRPYPPLASAVAVAALARPGGFGLSATAAAATAAALAAAQGLGPSVGARGVRTATSWGWILVPFLVALPQELLARASRAAGAQAILAVAETCTALSSLAEQITVDLLQTAHTVDWQRSLLPRFRQLHLLESMQALGNATMAVHGQPVVLVDLQAHTSVQQKPLATQDSGARLVPSLGFLANPTARITSVACGRNHLVFLDNAGRAWAAGDPRAGGFTAVAGGTSLEDPRPVEGLGRVHLIRVACGNGHTVAMSSDGEVFTWGRDVAGPAPASGDSSAAAWRLPDASRGLAGEAIDVAAGDSHIACVSLTGDTYVWGQNYDGQCARQPGGDVRATFLPSPALAGGALAEVVARRVACGCGHTAVLTAEGAVFTFGSGVAGQLGRPFSTAAALQVLDGSPPTASALHAWRPERVPFETCTGAGRVLIVQVVCGDEHTICLTENGRVIAFGSGGCGQLGLGGVRSHRSPVLVRTLSDICEVAAGGDWSMFRGRNCKVHLAGKASGIPEESTFLRQVVAAGR